MPKVSRRKKRRKKKPVNCRANKADGSKCTRPVKDEGLCWQHLAKAIGGNVGGRPKIELTPREVVQVEALAAVLTVEQIADYFGIDADTFSAICERDDEVLRNYKKGKARAIAAVASGLLYDASPIVDPETGERLGPRNLTAAIFYTKTQAGWKETERREIADDRDERIPLAALRAAQKDYQEGPKLEVLK